MGGLIPTYYLAFLISSFGGLAILYRENNEEETQFLLMNNEFDFYRKMPSLVFIAKFGIAMGLIATELAGHTDSRFFPIERRQNALVLVNLIVFSCASLAPMINEIDEPTPVVIFMILMLVLLIMTFTFMVPPESPLVNNKKRIQKLKNERRERIKIKHREEKLEKIKAKQQKFKQKKEIKKNGSS